MNRNVVDENLGHFPSPALVRYAMLFTTVESRQEIFRFDFTCREGFKVVENMLNLLESNYKTLGLALGESRKVCEGEAVVFLYFSHSNLSLSPGEGSAVYIGGMSDRGFQKEDNPPLARFLHGGWRNMRTLLCRVTC